jgi:tetratricopeptide (TPR) repeat protein
MPEIEEVTRAEWKKEGNAAFKSGEYALAIVHYTSALADESTTDDQALLLSNRAMARMKIADGEETAPAYRQEALEEALADAREAVAADASYAKGSYREAQAAIALGRIEEAIPALHRVWELQPGDIETHKLLRKYDPTAFTSRAALKAAGNASFNTQDYAAAVTQYSQALEDDSTDDDQAALLSNRAMARLKMAENKELEQTARNAMLQLALTDSREAIKADPNYYKASFREAQVLIALGRGDDPTVLHALYRVWDLAPGDKETHKLLLKHDPGFATFIRQVRQITANTEKKRENLCMMVHRSHPMSLRTAYYKTWMTQWTAADRETTLSEAYMKVIEALKENMKDEARSNAVEAIHRGDVSKSAGDGFDGYNYMNKQANILTNEAFELCSVVLGELISEESYNTPALYCSFVEQLSEKREDEERWLTQEMRWKLSSLRPTLLRGVNCVSHTLHRWMIMEMGLLLRKQVS